jgi:hypothetical protein
MPQKHTQHSCVAHPMYPELYKCNSWESTFVEFCVDGINLFVENNFIDSLGLGRDSNPDPSALEPSECTTTPSTSLYIIYNLFLMKAKNQCRNVKITEKLIKKFSVDSIKSNKLNGNTIQQLANSSQSTEKPTNHP